MTLVEKTGHPAEFSGYLRVVSRFPVTLACAAIFATIFIAFRYAIDTESPFFQEYWIALVGAFSLLFFLVPAALAVDLFSESRGWAIQRRLLLTGLAIVLCVLIVNANWQIMHWDTLYFGSSGLLILAILAPSLRPRVSNQAFWSVTRIVLTGGAFGLLVALIIAFGTTIGLELMDKHFDIEAPYGLEEYAWTASLAVILPILALLRMPDVSDAPQAEDAPGWLLFTFNRLLAPVALITAALFLAFAATTAIQWELPSRSSTFTVIVAAGLGVLVWLAFFPYQNQGSRALRLYQRTFPFALLVLAALPAAVTIARIADAGVIEQKLYWELLLSVTIGGIAVYLLAVRAPRLIVPPLAVALVLIGGSFGPWATSAINIEIRIGQFEALLEETGYLVDGRIVPEASKVDPETSRRLGSMVWTLRNNPGSEAFTEWLAEAGITIDGEAESIEVLERMGIKYVAEWEEEGRFIFALEEELLYRGRLRQPLDVAGYEVFAQVDVGGGVSTVEISAAATNQTYIVTIADLTLHIARAEDSAKGVTLDIRRIVEPLLETRTDETTVAPPDRMTVEAQNNGLRARFIVEELEGTSIDGVIEASGGRGVLLVGRAE